MKDPTSICGIVGCARPSTGAPISVLITDETITSTTGIYEIEFQVCQPHGDAIRFISQAPLAEETAD